MLLKESLSPGSDANRAPQLKASVGLLSPSIDWELVMDLKHLIYEDDVIAVGLISSRYENAKEEILSLVIRYLPPKTYHSKDGSYQKPPTTWVEPPIGSFCRFHLQLQLVGS